MNEVVLEVKDLSYSFYTYIGEIHAVRGVSFTLKRGESLGIVGESGCGKSVTAKCIARLNPEAPLGGIKEGSVFFQGEDLGRFGKHRMEQVRARDIRMIFQDPMTSLNPTMTIGRQIGEGLLKCGGISRKEAKKQTIHALKLAGIPNPEERYKQYPHEFSGGMRQRVMIALAMAVNPKLLIADEPTTALDVTTQAQILRLIKDIQTRYETAIIMITHDLGVVANCSDKIAVMYGGRIMEYGSSDDIFVRPVHPYTWGIMKSIVPPDMEERSPLSPIPGSPPDLFDPPEGCPFAPRCPYTLKVCRLYPPQKIRLEGEHEVACWLHHKWAGPVINPITGREVKL